MPHCYLLRSQPCPTVSYVGFTVDPAQRLRRHHSAHGAKATKTNRPWEYVVVVSGFASSTAAKCFEYAWQQPRTPWRAMQALLRAKGLMGAHESYTTLNGLTKDLLKDSDSVLWRLRVLAVMLGMGVWQGLTVQFGAAVDRDRARVHAGAPQPLSIERCIVQAFPAAAAPRARGALPAARVAPVPAAQRGGKKRPRVSDEEAVIIVVE